MTMFPALLAGANYVMHAAGWLESGLVSSYEKFAVDVEILGMLEEVFTPLEIDAAGRLVGSAPAPERLPLERWRSESGDGAWRRMLDEYEKPPIDDRLRDELRAFVDRRRRELGD